MALVTDRQKVAHLLRRFGLGASEAEINYYGKDGLNGAIELLLGYANVDEGFNIDVNTLVDAKGRLPARSVANWWVARLVMTRRPLQEKMTVFWHNHFATSATKVPSGEMMLTQNEILRRNATGNFGTLLSEVSKDPAMILWLDNEQNTRAHANENFAREVMELFTLGIGNYTEKDVQEGARAFTGWTLRRVPGDVKGSAEFLYRPRQHDDGLKTFLGNEGQFTGDDILSILCSRPRMAEFITQKLWTWFAYENPSPALVSRLAQVFRDNRLDIASLLRAMMKSPEFYSEESERKLFKNPVDFCVATLRQLGVGDQMYNTVQQAQGVAARRALAPANSAQDAQKGMGMWLLYPPDVSGWKPGSAWITSATMVERIGWGDRLFSVAPGTRDAIRYPAYGLFQQDPSPEGVVNRLKSLFDVPNNAKHQVVLVEAAEKAMGGQLTEDNANAAAAAVSRLIFATPEFQFA